MIHDYKHLPARLDRRDKIATAISEVAAMAVCFAYLLGVLYALGGGR
jgi:hypothetical protein